MCLSFKKTNLKFKNSHQQNECNLHFIKIIEFFKDIFLCIVLIKKNIKRWVIKLSKPLEQLLNLNYNWIQINTLKLITKPIPISDVLAAKTAACLDIDQTVRYWWKCATSCFTILISWKQEKRFFGGVLLAFCFAAQSTEIV